LEIRGLKILLIADKYFQINYILFGTPPFFYMLATVSIITQTKRLQLTTFYIMPATVFCAHQSAYFGDDLKRLIILNLKIK
jgi:hypothetical protein